MNNWIGYKIYYIFYCTKFKALNDLLVNIQLYNKRIWDMRARVSINFDWFLRADMMTFKLGTYICILSMIPKTSKHYQLFHPASGLIFSNFFFLIYDFKFFKVLHLYLCRYLQLSILQDLLFKSQSCIENNYILKIQVNKIINWQCSFKKNLNPLWVVHTPKFLF